jgi:hypothetical protein
MMNREQRIDYEILDRVFNAHPVYGYATDNRTFTNSLVALFFDVQPEDLIAACRRLIKKKRLDIRYEGNTDEAAVFAGNFVMARGTQSRVYFDELRCLIDGPLIRRAL